MCSLSFSLAAARAVGGDVGSLGDGEVEDEAVGRIAAISLNGEAALLYRREGWEVVILSFVRATCYKKERKSV